MSLPVIIHPEQDDDKLKVKGVSLCAFLDTVRKRKDGLYTVRIRIIHNRYPKYYTTKIKLSEKQYLQIAKGSVRKELNKKKIIIHELLKKAYGIIAELNEFTFDKFGSKFYNIKPAQKKNLICYYNSAIEQYKTNKQIGTASNYDLSLKSLLDFHKKSTLSFYAITPQWLKDYETYMVEVKERSKTTVGIYLRPLRAIFNNAIADKAINPEIYPFGKRKYQIPSPMGVKKALNKEKLNLLLQGKPQTPEQEKAKAFWFFSYYCNGMNIKDIANLKYKNVSEDTVTFYRAKTARTNAMQAPVIAYLNNFTKNVIEKYGNADKSPDNYVFQIIDPTASPEKRHRQIGNFIRYINQHLAKYTKSLGINEKISTYWARHSFATNAIRNGGSMELVSELLAHKNLKTTIGYFAGFENETKRDLINKLTEF